jgi:hypothetical protein
MLIVVAKNKVSNMLALFTLDQRNVNYLLQSLLTALS